MAIRPVDLQLAYLAGPQNAAAVSHAQDAPQAAQQAAQSAFAAEVTKREESVAEPDKAEGQKVQARREREPHEGRDERRRRRQFQEASPLLSSDVLDDGGDHLIDVTA